jgi:hypothetical protein
MTEQDNFEVWLSEFLEIDKESLEQCRYKDEDFDQGYVGLEAYGFSREADALAMVGLHAWLSATNSRKSVGIITSTDSLRSCVNVVYKTGTTLKIGQEVYQ